MAAFLEEFQHLKIDLEDIKSVTNNFDKTKVIGTGGFGKVYKGELCHYKGKSMVAIKRLDRIHGQGDPEFLKEIMLLSRYTHENIIALVGFCTENGEKILVYEHASNGSLDCHLYDTTLTWARRLSICLSVAKGLNYLHDPNGTHQRVLHCDIKSANILLDENWIAKVSDFGLSKIGPANQQHTFLISYVVGTFGYLDPLYMDTYILTKESDVYSFGVFLFEVLCGRLCFEYKNGPFQVLVPTWKKRYVEKKLDEIIFQYHKQQMDLSSLETFSDIAYQCLNKSREERPTMAHVVERLEIVIQLHANYNLMKLEEQYDEILKEAIPPLIYNSYVELNMLLSKGVLVKGGKTWFSVNENKEHYEMISAEGCSIPDETGYHKYRFSSDYKTRFPTKLYESHNGIFEAHVTTRFLSPLITYTVNLVFKFLSQSEYMKKKRYIGLRYKLKEETKYSISYIADEREDEWLILELYQFTSDGTTIDLRIQFESMGRNVLNMLVEGIEFRPIKKLEDEELEDEKTDMQSMLDSDTYWEEKLPNDCEDIIKWSKDDVKWTTKKELYSILCNGFLIENGVEWFFLGKNGKKCLMISPNPWEEFYTTWRSLPKSRFGKALVLDYWTFTIHTEVKSLLLSPQTTYTSYLVYKLPENKEYRAIYEGPIRVTESELRSSKWEEVNFWSIYLLSPQTSVIRRKVDQNTHNPLNRPKIKNFPRQRNDGWMEVQLHEFQTATMTEMIPLNLQFYKHDYTKLHGLILQGIELRPI